MPPSLRKQAKHAFSSARWVAQDAGISGKTRLTAQEAATLTLRSVKSTARASAAQLNLPREHRLAQGHTVATPLGCVAAMTHSQACAHNAVRRNLNSRRLAPAMLNGARRLLACSRASLFGLIAGSRQCIFLQRRCSPAHGRFSGLGARLSRQQRKQSTVHIAVPAKRPRALAQKQSSWSRIQKPLQQKDTRRCAPLPTAKQSKQRSKLTAIRTYVCAGHWGSVRIPTAESPQRFDRVGLACRLEASRVVRSTPRPCVLHGSVQGTDLLVQTQSMLACVCAPRIEQKP